jgi:hypothetical protein
MEFTDMKIKGMTMTSVEQGEYNYAGDCNDAIIFSCDDGKKYALTHLQDCCECVNIEDVCGDLDDLVGSPLTMAEEAYECSNDEYDSNTYSFYKFATAKGYVTVRFYGSSNGYYGEAAHLIDIENEE